MQPVSQGSKEPGLEDIVARLENRESFTKEETKIYRKIMKEADPSKVTSDLRKRCITVITQESEQSSFGCCRLIQWLISCIRMYFCTGAFDTRANMLINIVSMEEKNLEVQKKAPILTTKESRKLQKYINTHKAELWKQAIYEGQSVYLSTRKTKLARSIHVTPEGKVFVHLNKKAAKFNKPGDECKGKGSYKVVTTAIDLETGEEFASAATTRKEADKEVKGLAPFKGDRGFLQLSYRVDYTSGKSEKEKTRLLFPLKCEGQPFKGSLHENLSTMSPREQTIICKKLIQKLKVISDKGLVHRDIKPGNILLYGKGENIEPVVIDFSFMKEAGKKSNGGTGTDGYIPQEADKPGVVSSSHDVYSLGMTFNQVLTTPSGSWKSLIESMMEEDESKRISVSDLVEKAKAL